MNKVLGIKCDSCNTILYKSDTTCDCEKVGLTINKNLFKLYTDSTWSLIEVYLDDTGQVKSIVTLNKSESFYIFKENT